MRSSNCDSDKMASFRKSMSGGFSDGRRAAAQSEPAVVKKKLCRVSNGYANSRSLLVFNDKRNHEKDRKKLANDVTMSESVAREIGGDDLVEIHVVRGNCPSISDQADSLASIRGNTEVDKERLAERQMLNENAPSSNLSEENRVSSSEEQTKRVSFLDDVILHHYEADEEDVREDANDEIMYEILEESSTELNEDTSEIGTTESTESNARDHSKELSEREDTPTTQTSQPLQPRKTPLRRLILGQFSRAYNRAGVFRSFLRDSFRRPSSFPNAKSPLTRTRSLTDSSTRHNFISVEENSGTNLQLIIPLGNHYTRSSVLVKASGDGKKIRVMASRKISTAGPAPEDLKHDYRECFYLPKAIEPRQTKASVDNDGCLRIEAPFVSIAPKPN